MSNEAITKMKARFAKANIEIVADTKQITTVREIRDCLYNNEAVYRNHIVVEGKVEFGGNTYIKQDPTLNTDGALMARAGIQVMWIKSTKTNKWVGVLLNSGPFENEMYKFKNDKDIRLATKEEIFCEYMMDSTETIINVLHDIVEKDGLTKENKDVLEEWLSDYDGAVEVACAMITAKEEVVKIIDMPINEEPDPYHGPEEDPCGDHDSPF